MGVMEDKRIYSVLRAREACKASTIPRDQLKTTESCVMAYDTFTQLIKLIALL